MQGYYQGAMLSPRRRQVLIAGLASSVAPAVFAALPTVEAPQKLLLSGRVVGPDGKPLAGATVAAGRARTLTDADGRFMLITATPHYRVTYRARSTEGMVSNPSPDADGTARASIGLTLA
jgi:protocatechuate 3,4-dioxygenase beta subunit